MPGLPPIAHRVARLALVPVWLAQTATGAKSFRDNPILGSPGLNALGLHVGRMRLAYGLAERRRAKLARRLAPAQVEAFRRDGFVVVPDFLPEGEFARLADELRGYRGTAREMAQGDTITRRIALDPGLLAQCAAARRLLDNPIWRGLLRLAGSHDSEPVCYVQTILAGAREGDPDPQTALHADTFQPTVKAWLTLTDVAEDEGPFVYVPGSHRLTKAREAWERRMSIGARDAANRLTGRGSFRIAEAALPALGLAAPRAFAVKANTLIVADTCGFHARGPSARPGIRVEIWAYGRRNPFFSLPVDPWRIKALGTRRVVTFWRIGDLLERAELKPQVWRRRENVSAFDPAG